MDEVKPIREIIMPPGVDDIDELLRKGGTPPAPTVVAEILEGREREQKKPFNREKAAIGKALFDEPKGTEFILDGLFPVAAWGIVGMGGSLKTTLVLYIFIHVILGKPVMGKRVKRRGACLYVTAEDSKDGVLRDNCG